MVILETELNPVIMALLSSLLPQPPAGVAGVGRMVLCFEEAGLGDLRDSVEMLVLSLLACDLISQSVGSSSVRGRTYPGSWHYKDQVLCVLYFLMYVHMYICASIHTFLYMLLYVHILNIC